MALSKSAQTAILTKIRSARNVVILSGAGLSAESGIPTFRDASNSLWANVDPMAVASLDGFERDPERVWAWHDEMRRKRPAQPRPSRFYGAVLKGSKESMLLLLQLGSFSSVSFSQALGSRPLSLAVASRL